MSIGGPYEVLPSHGQQHVLLGDRLLLHHRRAVRRRHPAGHRVASEALREAHLVARDGTHRGVEDERWLLARGHGDGDGVEADEPLGRRRWA